MNIDSRYRSILACLLATAVGAGAQHASGQTAASPAIFGGATSREEQAGGGLDALIELFQAYDDNVLAGENGASGQSPATNPGVGGAYSGLGLAAQYEVGNTGPVFRTWMNSAFRHYPALHNLNAGFHQAGATFSQPLGRHFAVQVSPFAAYSPHYSMVLFPAADGNAEAVEELVAPPAPNADFGIVARESIRYGGNASINYSMTRQSSVSVRYGYAKTSFQDESMDLDVQNAGINFSHRFTRNASLRAGYTRQDGNYHAFERRLVENVNLGIDYRKPLSRSRRTFLRFSTGSVVAEDGGARRMQATGSASLSHHIGRTWMARADYRRGVRYLDGFDRPIFADSAGATLAGLLNRRLELTFNGGYFNGTVGLSPDSPKFDSYAAVGRVRAALSRTLAAYVEYRFYRYRFDADAARPAELPEAFDRTGARVGMMLFVPVFD